ncbi:hypothetical protein M153_2030003646 [Pseudoloma neurophilia]|uniref:Transposable element n=1 Tax=Pseudoloma neurophilia TaxID=146866 RepID=A0A0R0LZH1_9MICR|nr:hypothetical protein M153_2030003646 [Pseudoloma neurophilia]
MAVQKWQSIIGGSQITTFTDSNNNLGHKIDFSKRMHRWKALLSDLDIKYEFINGDQNVSADSLSGDICATIFEKEMRSFHILHGHPGLTKTFQTLNLSKKLTKSQKNSITQIISNCDFCQLKKVTKHKYGHLSGRVRTESPFVHISSVIFGPFESKFY